MAVTWTPLTHLPRPPAAPEDVRTSWEAEDADSHGLADFPSERESAVRQRGGHTSHHSGVTMRVETISWGVAWLLAAIIMLGLSSAVAIGILAGSPERPPRPAAEVSAQR